MKSSPDNKRDISPGKSETPKGFAALDSINFPDFAPGSVWLVGAGPGAPGLLTRRPDVEQARRTSIIEDIRVWYDTEDANPAQNLKAILEGKGLQGRRLGIELATYGLTAANYVRVKEALDGWCELVDASDLVRSLRMIKSPAELA